MNELTTVNIKKRLTLSIIVVATLIFLLIATAFSAFALGPNATTIRNNLWTKGGVTTMSNSEILTLNALVYYAESGVWGHECQQAVNSSTNTMAKLKNACPAASKWYDKAAVYGDIVDARMKIADPTGTKVDNAMLKFTKLADEIFAIMIGFGCLTAILCFTIIFMRLAWMPSHAIERRRILIDVATSGASIMLLGNIWIVLSLFQAVFNRFWQTFAVYSKDWRTVANMVLVEYKGFITGLSGLATLLVLAMFVVNFIGLALDGGTATKRSGHIQNILHCAIAAAGLGSITLIVGFFWNLFA